MNIPRPEHPNPQFERKNWLNLNGKWDFEIDSGVSGRERELFKNKSLKSEITVPFCPESKLSGIGITDYMNCVWYLKKVTLPESAKDKTVILHFGAVDYESYVYVNGKEVKHHIGGFASFECDITDYIVDGENIITVCAIDKNEPKAMGKQSDRYASYNCFYTRTTGIWQTVWLEFVEKNHIKKVKYYPCPEQSNVIVEVQTVGSDDFCAECFYDGKKVGETSVHLEEGLSRVVVNLDELHFWSVGEGNLYDVVLTYGKDKVSSYFGIRTVGLDKNNFLLNGKPLFLRTVLDQGFYKDGIYTAKDEDELKRDIDLSLDAGFNGARLHQKVFEARFLYHCDKKGYLVFGETGNWGLDPSDIRVLPNFMNEWIEIIDRDFNHPSIVGWCPLNETWDYYNRHQDDRLVTSMYNITKAQDPTRICVGTSGNYQVVSDIYDLHDYLQGKEEFESIYLAKDKETMLAQYDKTHEAVAKYQNSLDWKDYPLYISEYGGISWDKAKVGGWGYGNAPKTEEEFFDRYEYLTKALINCPYIFGFCYTQLYDVEQEVNGLYTYEREPKFDMKKISAITKYEKE